MRTIKLKTLIITTLLALAASLIPAQAQRFSIFDTNHVWRYNASTTPGFCLNGTGWEQELFDDSAWLSGPGGFTGGETAAAALVGVTTRTLPAPPASSGAPQYFRTVFNLPSSVNVSLTFSNRIDDQAVIYLNGMRIASYQHPDDPEVCPAGGAGGGEANAWVVGTLTPTQLAGIIKDGDNVLAVSIHQNSTTSSDMVFVQTLTGEIAFAPINCGSLVDSVTNVPQCATISLAACIDGGPTPTLRWFHNGVAIDDTLNPTATNANLVITNAQAANAGTYVCVGTNPSGTANSAITTVTVEADVTGPILLSVVGGAPGQADDGYTLTLTFNEPILDPAANYDAANVTVTASCGGDPLFGLFSFGAVVTNLNQVLIQTDNPRVPGGRYDIQLAAGAGLQDSCVGNNLGETSMTICVTTEFQEELNGYVGSEDAELRSSDGLNATPQGANLIMNVDLSDGTPAGPSHSILKFGNIVGNGAGQVPPGATVIAVQLILHSGAANADSPDQTRVHRMLLPWDEATATWDSFVAGITADGTEAAVTPDSAYAPNLTVPFTIIRSDAALVATVQAWVNDPTSNHGWALLPTGGNGYRIDTSEDADIVDRPRLVVCYTVAQSPIVITRQPAPMIMVNEGETVVVDVENSGSDPIYEWKKGVATVADGGRVSGATTARLVISSAVPADGGDYRVNITNCVPSSALSTIATVIVKADTTSPTIVAVCGLTNLDCILVSFSELVTQATAENIANYLLSGGLTVASVTLTNGTNVIIKTTTRTPGQNYTLQVSGVTDLSAAGNVIATVSQTIPQLFVLFGYDKVWRYEQTANLDGTGWEQPSYDDSAWPSGAGLLAVETTAGTIALLPAINTALTVSTNQPTYYFRTKFDFPYDTAGVSFEFSYPIDDGGVVRLNGGVAFVHNMTNDPVSSIVYSSLAAVTETEGAIYRTNLNVLPGENTLAVDVHQVSLTSSDIVWGGQLIAKVPEFRAPCPRPRIALIIHAQDPLDVWVVIEWDGVGTLQGANEVAGPYTDIIPAATSPHMVRPTDAFKFYRTRCAN